MHYIHAFCLHYTNLQDRQTDRQFIQTYQYSTSSQHKLYNELYHMYLHICEIQAGIYWEQNCLKPCYGIQVESSKVNIITHLTTKVSGVSK